MNAKVGRVQKSDRLRSLFKRLVGEWRQFRATEPQDTRVFMARVRFLERNIGIPARLIVLPILFFYLFGQVGASNLAGPRADLWQDLRNFTLIYAAFNLGSAIILWGMQEVPTALLTRVVYVMAILDGAFLGSLTLLSGGFESILYWVFPGLIVRNAAVISFAEIQIIVNVLSSVWYVLAGLLDVAVDGMEQEVFSSYGQGSATTVERGSEPVEAILLRVLLLLLLTALCYGLQVLLDRKRQREIEAQEFALKQEQLQAAGRLAAEIAHQLKNPLGIINNAAYTLHKTVREGKTITQQISIIREEVARSDRIITELMGYAQLAEGKVERVDAPEVLEAAIGQALPPAAGYEIKIHRDYGPALPALLGQKGHFIEIFNNLLVNAREAMNGKGEIFVSVRSGADYSVNITIRDSGPGIDPATLSKIWEPYYTTKVQGTGLGLAIVKHNAELYGGKVKIESELGKGAAFTVTLPARTVMRLRP